MLSSQNKLNIKKNILFEQYFRKLDKEALNVVEMAEKEVQEKGGYFVIQKNLNDKFPHSFYIREDA